MHIKPARISIMNKLRNTTESKTFCQLLREIYHDESSDKLIKLKSRYAVGYAKNIVRKLKTYKQKLGG